jgi:hypothetical protein
MADHPRPIWCAAGLVGLSLGIGLAWASLVAQASEQKRE